MSNWEIDLKIRKWKKNYICDKHGKPLSYLWNGIVYEEIQKLELLKQ